MKVFVALSVFLAAACAAPQRGFDKNYNQKQVIPILKFDSQQNHDGSYRYGYETGNGIAVQEQGYVKNLGVKDSEIQTAQGFFSYTSPEGKPITLHYTADENGFQATGDHLPTPPPLPKEIADVWAKINAERAANPQQSQQQDQYYDQDLEQDSRQQQQYYKDY